MTTTVSFATRDCLVIGCDSLATATQKMINPYKVWANFFDENGQLKKDENGNSLLNEFDDIYNLSEDLPYNQSPNVTKIFDLNPADCGLLFAGIAGIGDRSVKNLVEEFKSEPEIEKYFKGTYTISGISERLFKFLKTHYDSYYKDKPKPGMEVIISGYSKQHDRPEIYKLIFSNGNDEVIKEIERSEYGVIFGGQVDVIQRVVHGLDISNRFEFMKRIRELFVSYNEILLKDYIPENSKIKLPDFKALDDKANKLVDELDLYSTNWAISMSADVGNFSEQAAIDFVSFLINIMIKFQHFSSRLPTVGGNVHIAILTKSNGFNWISKEEYKYENHSIPKYNAK